MFTLFINLLFFALLYFIYLILKSKAYQINDNSSINQDTEILIFPLALYIYFLLASMHFQMLSDSGITFLGLSNLSHLKFIPFEDWFLQYDYSRFMAHVYADYNTFTTSILTPLLQNLGFHIAYLIPIAFALKSIYHSWKKTILIFFPITLLVGLQSYELNIGMIIVAGFTSYIIGSLLSNIVSFLINKKANLKPKLTFLSVYAVLLVSLAIFLSNTTILNQQSNRIQTINFTDQETFTTFDDQISLRPIDYKKEDNKTLDIKLSVSPLPTLSLPYNYHLQSITYRFETDGVPLLIGGAFIEQPNDQKIEDHTSSIYLSNIDYNSRFTFKNIYPVNFYGIDSITYYSKDPLLLNQLEVINTNWSYDIYDYYEITYRVPVLDQKEVKWHVNVTYDNPLLKETATESNTATFYNDENSPTLYSYYDTPILISEDTAYKTYKLKCYFYQYGHGAFSKEEIKGIKTISRDVQIDISPETKSEEPIWVIEADTLE